MDDTLACLKTIDAIEYPALHVVVVDNASTDVSADRIRAEFPKIPLLQNARNLGYAEGNNVAIRLALKQGMDYILIVNPDVRLPPESIAAYVRLMEADSSISALNPIQLTGDGMVMDEFFRREMFDYNNQPTPQLPTEVETHWDVRTLFGAALFISCKTLEKVGLFDPLFFAYWEEVDLCRRIKLHGGRLVVTSAAPIVHLRSYKAKGRDPFRAFLRLKGMQLYSLKDPKTPLSRQAWTTLVELVRNIVRLPANDFGWRRLDYIRTLAWVVIHLPEIWGHREMDRVGKAYL